MNIYKIELNKDDLFSLPANERIFLVYAGHALNELNILCRLVVFAMPTRRNEAERQFMVIQSFTLLRLLAGKLHEMWVLFGKAYYGSKLSATLKGQLGEEADKSLKTLTDYFSKPKTSITRVRHLLGFHYDIDQVDAGLAKLAADLPLDIYFDTVSANTIYGFADNIINSAMMAAVDLESRAAATEILMDDTETVAKAFQETLEAIMSRIIQLRLPDRFAPTNVLSESTTSTQWKEMKLPTFVEAPTPWSVTLTNARVLSWGGQKIESPSYLRSLLVNEEN